MKTITLKTLGLALIGLFIMSCAPGMHYVGEDGKPKQGIQTEVGTTAEDIEVMRRVLMTESITGLGHGLRDLLASIVKKFDDGDEIDPLVLTLARDGIEDFFDLVSQPDDQGVKSNQLYRSSRGRGYSSGVPSSGSPPRHISGFEYRDKRYFFPADIEGKFALNEGQADAVSRVISENNLRGKIILAAIPDSMKPEALKSYNLKNN